MPIDWDRLNWLIRQGPPGATEGMGLNQESWNAAYHSPGTNDLECMRAAIDAAMARTPSQEKGGRGETDAG